MEAKHEQWMLKAVNDILKRARSLSERLDEIEGRMRTIENTLISGEGAQPPPAEEEAGTAGVPGEMLHDTDVRSVLAAFSDNAPTVRTGAVEPDGDAAAASLTEMEGRPAGAPGPAPEGEEEGEATPGPAARKRGRTGTRGTTHVGAAAGGHRRGRKKTRKEIRASLAEDPEHCPECGARLPRKARRCKRCGFVLPGGGCLKKLFLLGLFFVVALAGAAAALHFTGKLRGVMEKIPVLKDQVPKIYGEPAPEPEQEGESEDEGESEPATPPAAPGGEAVPPAPSSEPGPVSPPAAEPAPAPAPAPAPTEEPEEPAAAPAAGAATAEPPAAEGE